MKAQTLAGQLTIMPMGELVNYQLTSDAKRIIYIERDSIKSNIWWCNVDGSDREALTKTQGYNGRSYKFILMNKRLLLFLTEQEGMS